jgi:choline transport protein
MLGSDTALNVFMNCTATLGLLTYVPLFITSMVRGRSFYRGPFHMGKWGWIPNILACVFMSFFIVFWHFPYFKDWTPEMFSMYLARFSSLTADYNIAIVPGLLLLGIVAWFVSGRKTYLMFRHIE